MLYFFERFSASKLGQPVMLRDDDIDVELPSMDGLTEEERAEFLEPIPIVTNIKLGKIIGNIRRFELSPAIRLHMTDLLPPQ